MRFVPPKSVDQLAVQAVHRIRRRLVADRVRLVNQIRGLLSEHGIVIARDITQLRRSLADIVGNIDDGLSDLVRSLMRDLQAEMAELDVRRSPLTSGYARSSAIASSASGSGRLKALAL